MNRDIEFRGKRIDGKWVIGHGFIIDNFTVGSPQSVYSDERFKWYKVIPETVGQYTGSLDRKGVKIFEGDIVKYDREDAVAFEIKWIDGRGFIGISPFSWNVKKQKNVLGEGNTLCYLSDTLEVIGNIHDNPELLEGKS